MVTTLPKARSLAACLARVPKGWPDSGASTPWSRTLTGSRPPPEHRQRVAVADPDDAAGELVPGDWSDQEDGQNGQARGEHDPTLPDRDRGSNRGITTDLPRSGTGPAQVYLLRDR